jgi:hypothetical protein
MYIEDLLYQLDTKVRYHTDRASLGQDSNIVSSLTHNCRTGAGLTFKQRALAVRILKKYHQDISATLGQDVLSFIESSQFKTALRVPIEAKTAVIEERQGKQIIVVQFPYDSATIALIHDHKQKHYSTIGSDHVYFEHATKSWLFDINEVNLCFLARLASHGFYTDPALLPALDRINQIIEKVDEYLPHLAAGKQGYHLINVADSIPPLASSDLVAALMHARRYGINDWDDTVQLHIENDPLVKRIEKFFRYTSPGGLVERHSIEYWVPILPHCEKVLFVVPGGIELAYTAQIHDLLLANGYRSNEISVMFRTCNKRKPEFNKYVNEHQLNNPFSGLTRAVMISGGLPKPLVSKDFNFDLVVCGGNQYGNARLRNYLNQQHNVVWIEHQESDV